jgi:undecaprenyl-diphosphatase
MFRGLDREFAARYSFLVSVPVILGANLLEVKDALDAAATGGGAGTIGLAEILGMLAAAVAGYAAIKYMIRIIVTKGMRQFAWYVWILGGLILFDQIVTKIYFHF